MGLVLHKLKDYGWHKHHKVSKFGSEVSQFVDACHVVLLPQETIQFNDHDKSRYHHTITKNCLDYWIICDDDLTILFTKLSKVIL